MAIFSEIWRTGNYFKGLWEQAHSFGDLGSPAKKSKKNLTLKEKSSFRLILFLKNLQLLGGYGNPPDPLGKSKCIYFRANTLICIGIGD